MASRVASAVKTKSSATKLMPPAKPVKKTTAKKGAEKTEPADVGAEPTVKPRRKSKVETRTRIYWGVYNQMAKRVAVFEFDQKVEAEKRAAKLLKSSGEHHYIQKLKAVVAQ